MGRQLYLAHCCGPLRIQAKQDRASLLYVLCGAQKFFHTCDRDSKQQFHPSFEDEKKLQRQAFLTEQC